MSIQLLTQEDHQEHSFVIDETIRANGHGGPALELCRLTASCLSLLAFDESEGDHDPASSDAAAGAVRGYRPALHHQDGPERLQGQVVTSDRESCLLYKTQLDKLLLPEVSAVVMTVNANEPQYKAFSRIRDEEDRLVDGFLNCGNTRV